MPGSDAAALTNSAQPAQRRTRTLLLLLAVGASYYLGARLGFVLRFPPATTSVIWPPNALLTAALMLTPPRRWWLVLFAAALPAHLLVEIQAGFPVALLVPLFFTNSLEAVVAAAATRRWSDGEVRFDSLQRVLAFVAGAVFLAPLVSTFPDAAVVHFVQGEPFGLVCLRRILLEQPEPAHPRAVGGHGRPPRNPAGSGARRDGSVSRPRSWRSRWSWSAAWSSAAISVTRPTCPEGPIRPCRS